MLDARISGDAALLLLRMRRISDENETDGHIETRDLRALAAFHSTSESSMKRSLGQLVRLGLVTKQGRVYVDSEFKTWCRSHEQRVQLRREWREAKRNGVSVSGSASGPDSTSDSKVDSMPDSMVDSDASLSLAPSESLTPSAAPTPDALQENETKESFMPRQADVITILEGWESIVGRPARLDEISHAGWLLDQYNRLSANQILEVIERIHGRELTKGNPTHPLTYYDGPIRDLNDSAKPRRAEPIPHGDGEPEPSGNGHVSPEQVESLRQQAAAMAANKGL